MSINNGSAPAFSVLRIRLTATWASVALAAGGMLAPARAQAMDRDVKTVIVAGSYGLVGGTVLGLASYPFSKDARTVFIGSSVGLYLGIVVGVYYVLNRENPENPLRPEYGRLREPADLDRGLKELGAEAPLRFSFTVARF